MHTTIFLLLCLAAPLLWAINNLPARFEEVNLAPCEGWQKFLFGNSGDFSYSRFHIRSDCQIHLHLTDAFCAGDEFMVYDWGRKVGAVRVPYDSEEPECEGKLCKRPEADPEKAWECGRFAHRQFLLRAGEHRITIKSLKSPIGAGYAFIKLMPIKDCSCKHDHGQCPIPEQPCHSCPRHCSSAKHPDTPHCDNKFTILPKATCHASAASACAQKGMKLAAITTSNFADAAHLIFASVGASGKAWIASYNGDAYNDGCLAFNVGSSLPSGNINLAECGAPIAVLCERS